MELPFISRRSHLSILAAKEETIALLRGQVARLEQVLVEERSESRRFAVTALDALKPAAVTPSPQRRARPSNSDAEPQKAVPIDLTLVDPADNEALAFLVRQETSPGTRLTGTQMLRSIEHMRHQVVEAHRSKMNRAMQPVMVPDRVQDRIEAAEKAGMAMASGG